MRCTVQALNHEFSAILPRWRARTSNRPRNWRGSQGLHLLPADRQNCSNYIASRYQFWFVNINANGCKATNPFVHFALMCPSIDSHCAVYREHRYLQDSCVRGSIFIESAIKIRWIESSVYSTDLCQQGRLFQDSNLVPVRPLFFLVFS